MAADDADDRIELTDLDVIARFSLAVRAATADREDVIAALRSDLAWLESERPARARRTSSTTGRTARKTTRRTPSDP